MTRKPLSLGLCLLSLLSLGACSDDDDAPSTAQAPADGTIPLGTTYGFEEDLPDGPPAVGQWVEGKPGKDTVCSRGTEYRFFVRGGLPDKIIIDFQGGGACWNAMTCGFATAIFSEEVGDLLSFTDRLSTDASIGGIYDASDARYPFKDYTLIHIPYCTGDIHWGDNEVEYGPDLTIRHRGYRNATRVLEWVYANYPNPDTVLVTGCSAGAYGAIVHSANISDRYPNSKLAVMSDSGAGIITPSFLQDSLPNWDAQKNLPPRITRLQRPLSELTMQDVYAGVANAYPDRRFSHYSTAFDADQTFYFQAMGGKREDWPGLARGRMEAIRAESPNFRYYIAPGPVHCITPYDFMYDRTTDSSGQQTFTGWLDQLVNGETPPEDATCTGEGCYTDSVCDACAADNNMGAHCRFCSGWPDSFRPQN